SVLTPVRVRVGVVPVVPLVGLIASVGVATAIVPAAVPVPPSVRVRVPVAPAGGVADVGGARTTVAAVPPETVVETTDQPATPEAVIVVVPLTHAVPVPV